MFLDALRIQNFRSLEHVELERLSQFNVLVGRNNAGKSTIFNVLAALANLFQGNGSSFDQLVTGLDPTRSPGIDLTFSLRELDRQNFADVLLSGEVRKSRREQLLASGFASRTAFSFRGVPGRTDLFHLRETKLIAEDGNWATLGRLISDETSDNPVSEFLLIGHLTDHQPEGVLSAFKLDLNGSRESISDYITQVRLARIYPSSAISDSAAMWLLERLGEYFQSAFFFTPFRHSSSSMQVQEAQFLDQNGVNLAQVLHSINSNDRANLLQIEEFLHAALPNIGMLQTPLHTEQTSVGFRQPRQNQLIPLHNMGGGVEQLLMVATVLLTTDDACSLFLEEPESHLHPAAQRFLIERLIEGNRQVFVTTHSSTFVNLTQSHSLYQVTLSQEGRSTVTRLEEHGSLGPILADIGARKSDLVLSDAVLFVEGPGDRDAFEAWSELLGEGLSAHNVAVLPIDGGEYADRYAPPRDRVLEQISKRSLPIPRLFVLDRDHRSDHDIAKLMASLEGRVRVLARRELENYFLVPRVLLAALREKYRYDESRLKNVEALSEESIVALIQTTTDSLYGIVLLKRVGRMLGGLAGGLMPRDIIERLTPLATESHLSSEIENQIDARIDMLRRGLNVKDIVQEERRLLDEQWKKIDQRRFIAPGEEIVEAVFHSVGGHYTKPKDTEVIARTMRAEELDPEIIEIISEIVASSRGSYSAQSH